MPSDMLVHQKPISNRWELEEDEATNSEGRDIEQIAIKAI